VLLRPRLLLQSLALGLCALSMNGCFFFCLLSPDGCSREDPITVNLEPVVSLLVNPLKLDVIPGGSATATVSVGVSGGPSGASLSLGALPAGVTVSFDRATVAGSGSAVLTLTAATTAPPGLLVVEVIATATGTGAGTVGRTTLTAEVLKPFQLRAPAPQNVTAGSSIDIPVAITRVGGFAGAVSIGLDAASVPAGSTVTFNPSPFTGTSTTLSLAVPTTARTGRYLVRMMGSFGASADTAALWLLNVFDVPVPPEITILGTPTAETVVPGGNATFALAMTRSGPGLGNINLTVAGVPAGANATFTPQSVSGNSAQLAVTTSVSTPDGSYPLVVTATAGALVRQTTVTLTVATPADFALATSPTTLTVARGATAQTTVAIQRTGAPGAVSLDVTGVPANVVAIANPVAASGNASVITLSVAAAALPGTYALSVRGIAGALTRSTPLTLIIPAPPANTVTIEVLTPVVTIAPRQTALIPVRINRTGTMVGLLLELRVTGAPTGGEAWVGPSWVTGDTTTLQVIGGTLGTSRITVMALIGQQPPSAVATVNVVASTTPDFSLVPRPNEVTMAAGDSTAIPVSILRANGHSGPVVYDAITDDPPKYRITFVPDVNPNNPVRVSIATTTTLALGKHLLILRGQSGGLTRLTLVTLIVEDGYSYYGYTRKGEGLERDP